MWLAKKLWKKRKTYKAKSRVIYGWPVVSVQDRTRIKEKKKNQEFRQH